MEFFDEDSYFSPHLGTEDLGLVHCAFHQIASSEPMVKTFNKVINRKQYVTETNCFHFFLIELYLI